MNLRLALLVSILSSSSACSLAFVETHPGTPEVAPCTTSNTAPIVDTVLAVAYGGAAIGTAIAAAEGDGGGGFLGTPSNTTLAVTSGLAAAVFGVSAAHGFDATSSCRRLNAEAQRRLDEAAEFRERLEPASATPAQVVGDGAR